jgi:hypothetical protein
MVNLCCPQCQTTLPVAKEKLGKTLFVCPKCAFPLEAPGEGNGQGPAKTEAYIAPLPVPPPSPYAGLPSPYAAAAAPSTPPKMDIPAKPAPRMPAPAGRASVKKSSPNDKGAPNRKGGATGRFGSLGASAPPGRPWWPGSCS